ncbi:MAG TPA: PorV/PorQ family protein [Candidatus Marinimicrobia bacterium]|nr:PorV/PorQ family protein [Candidatus Neomarinimicrobiota bacterium]
MKIKHISNGIQKAVLLTMMLSVSLFAQKKIAGSAANFLGIGVGAKGLSQGSSMVARASDAAAIYWNPGAIAQLDKNTVTFSATKWLVDTEINYGALVFKPTRQDAIGVSFFNLNYGEEEVTTEYLQEGAGEYWDANDFNLTLNYARMLTDRFSIGGAVKFLQQNIWHEKASTVAVDVGILFKTQLNGLNIGMSIANYGSDMEMNGPDLYRRIDIDPDNLGHNETLVARMKTEAYPLPLLFRIGLAYEKSMGALGTIALSTDAVVPSDNMESINVGAEWRVMNVLALRAGYKALGDDDTIEGLTLGGGLILQRGINGISLDYSFQEFKHFENVQTFGVSLTF